MVFKHFEVGGRRDLIDYSKFQYPNFLKDVWPFITKNAKGISRVYIFSHRGSKIRWKTVQKYLHHTVIPQHNFLEFPGLMQLDRKFIDSLCDWSYLSYHFNVFYQSKDQNFLNALCGLYPPITREICEDNLDIKNEEDQLNLKELFKQVDPDSFLISFPSEADFLAVFGSDDLLARLANV